MGSRGQTVKSTLGRARRWVLGGAGGGRRATQPVYRRLHEAALRGRGFGLARVDDSGEEALLAHIHRDHPELATIFDVGANVGDWSVAAARRWPGARLHAFEPAAAPFAALTSAVDGLAVTCVHSGVSDHAGQATLHAVPGLPGLSSLHERDLAVQQLEMSEKESVDILTLDDYCAEHGIDHIDLLKVDTEGHELAVLRGAAGLLEAGRIRRIQFEFGGANIDSRTYLRDFVRLLEPGYRISRILVDGTEPLVYRESEEIFVTTNFYAEAVSG
jgi:FkbM family methyltransferase